MNKKVYISGNTANCFDEFSLCCTKDFDNKFLTNNSSIVDNEEYFYADFGSVENIESYYENRIIKLQDEITDLRHQLEATEKTLGEMSKYAINDNDLYDLVSDFNIENERYDEDHFGIDTCDVVDYFKEKAKLNVGNRIIELYGEINDLTRENKQLKQSQKQLAIEVLEKVKNYFDDRDDDRYDESDGWIITNRSVVEYVDKQIKELNGE